MADKENEMNDDIWYYYLHTNGSLICKRFAPEYDSDFVKKIWKLNTKDRESGYVILIEAAALGADMDRIIELAKHWGMDGKDGLIFCEKMGFICKEIGIFTYEVSHKEDPETRTHGKGISPLFALIDYVKQGDFGKGV